MDKKIVVSVVTAGALVLATNVTALAASKTAPNTAQHHTSIHQTAKHASVAHHSSSRGTRHSFITNHNTDNKAPAHESHISSKDNRGHQGPKKNTISDGTYTENFTELGVPTHGTAKVIDNGKQLTGTDYVVYRGKHYMVTFDQNLSGQDITGGTYTVKNATGTAHTVTLSQLNVPLKRDGNHLTPSVSIFTVADVMRQVLK